MSGPRVFNSKEWVALTEDPYKDGSPPPQVEDGDGKIFVVIPTFRGWYISFCFVIASFPSHVAQV
jgi:hypothetical protein